MSTQENSVDLITEQHAAEEFVELHGPSNKNHVMHPGNDLIHLADGDTTSPQAVCGIEGATARTSRPVEEVNFSVTGREICMACAAVLLEEDEAPVESCPGCGSKFPVGGGINSGNAQLLEHMRHRQNEGSRCRVLRELRED